VRGTGRRSHSDQNRLASALHHANVNHRFYGWVLLLVSTLIAIAAYFCRLNVDQFFLNLGMGTAFLFVALSPIILLLGLVFVFHIYATLRYSIRKKQIVPSFILFGGLMTSLFLLPLPLSPEEKVFVEHQQQYEQLVELARLDQLQHDDICRATTAFVYPEDYQHLTGEDRGENCIFVELSPVFSVTFSPRSFYRPIVYVEKPTEVEKTRGVCGADGTIRKKLKFHWYICNRDFN
jgi:hypothetical protein